MTFLPEFATSQDFSGSQHCRFGTNLFCWDNWPFYDPEGGMLTGTNVFQRN
jgi:hypothetical protein